MDKIDKKIEQAKKGKSILQNMMGEYSYQLVYTFGDFFLETYKHDFTTQTKKLKNVECIDEETARFALTARYS